MGVMKILEIYNKLQKQYPNAEFLTEKDIVEAVGEESFSLLVRNFMITLDHKDENGVWLYSL